MADEENSIPRLSGSVVYAQGASADGTVPAGEVWEVVSSTGPNVGMFYVEGQTVAADVVKKHTIA